MKKRVVPSFYNTLSLIGSGFFLLNIGLIVLLSILQLLAKHPEPHADMVIFMILPALALLGLIVAIVGMVRERRRMRTGAPEQRLPVLDLNEPRFRSGVFVLGGIFILVSLVYAFAGYRAYEYSDSDTFCSLCHAIRPEYEAHLFSAHANIACSECHIGAGARHFIRVKLNGTIELYKYLFNKYPRPLHTPIRNLRPSRDICETCHGPKYQLGEKLVSRTVYLADKENTKWTIYLLLKMGAGRIETETPPRIHWHTTVAKEIWYTPADAKRMVIPRIRVVRFDGTERVYQSSDSNMKTKDLSKAETRLMDCIDCHNREGHYFRPPARSVNAFLQTKLIDPSLPEIKSIAVKALDGAYQTKQAGFQGIAQQITDFYRTKYPDIATSKKAEIEGAASQLQRIYARNYDPAMKVSWKNFPENAGHMYSLGCFRCHDGKHVANDGTVLSKDCNLCHLLLTRELAAEGNKATVTLAQNPHPVDVGNSYKEEDCSGCHGQ